MHLLRSEQLQKEQEYLAVYIQVDVDDHADGADQHPDQSLLRVKLSEIHNDVERQKQQQKFHNEAHYADEQKQDGEETERGRPV